MTSILITTQDHLTDATQTKSLKVNPAAATGRLKTWAQMGVNLSKDSYVKTVRIDETDLDAESKIARPNNYCYVQISKLTTEIALTGNSFSVDIPLSSIASDVSYLDIKYRAGDCDIVTKAHWIGEQELFRVGYHSPEFPVAVGNKSCVIAAIAFTREVQTIFGILHIDENEKYQALDLPITINITEG